MSGTLPSGATIDSPGIPSGTVTSESISPSGYSGGLPQGPYANGDAQGPQIQRIGNVTEFGYGDQQRVIETPRHRVYPTVITKFRSYQSPETTDEEPTQTNRYAIPAIASIQEDQQENTGYAIERMAA